MKNKEEKQESFCIIGAGMSGLLMAIRLKKAGFSNIRILEKAPDLGGTWYYNRYPGVACDVPAPYYSYSFALNPDWSRKFAPGKEIFHYFKNVARNFQLEDLIEFNCEAVEARFDGCSWKIKTNLGESISVDFLVSACGILHKPVYPDISGMDSFQGKVVHSSAWDEDYPWQGKRIAIIGNGSTGVQMLPKLAQQAEKLVLFQRTPQWIMPSSNKTYSSVFKLMARYVPGFKQFQYWSNRKTFEAFTQLVLHDGWQRQLTKKLTRASLNTVADEALRKKLTPDYAPGCKRLVLSNDYYRSIQKNNVQLCTEGIKEITETGICTEDGSDIAVDLIVLATGFDPRAYMRPMKMINEAGLSLDGVWSRQGIKAYRTVALPDFPNFFMVLGPNSPVGNFSVIAAAEEQSNYILQCINKKISSKSDSIAPSHAACEKYNIDIQKAMKSTIWLTGCQSWYLDEQGNSATWPWTPKKFRKDLRKVNFNDFVFRDASKEKAE